MDSLKPRDGKDVEAAVQWALAGKKALEIVGRGSKRPIGRPAQSDLTLDLSGLSGVTLYEPEELVLSAKAATPISEIEALVAAKGQALAFEPMDYGPLLGVARGGGSIGGVLAANLAGPRRIKAGAARDHFLGVSAISGRGETFKSGGRVVKNVTGYDLCKLIAGSWGTLAAMADVTVKTLPGAETEATVLLLGLGDAEGVAAMTDAMGSGADVSAAAHLPARVASRIAEVASAATSATALRLEGVEPSVRHRRGMVEAMFAGRSLAVLEAAPSRAFWLAVRDVTPFAADGPAGARAVWRVSTTPSRGHLLAAAVQAAADAEVTYDWAGGLLWLALPPGEDAGAAVVREALHTVGGHATLIRAPAAVRAAIDVFEPQESGLAALTRRVKESFDPHRVLNPGRMWAGV
jgi:glycolate oxidase FAD binding subunit